MGDIKVFRTNGNSAIELQRQSVSIEKSLQSLLERNLEVFLGVRFLASEYSTGKTHGGRIDTLGIDENGCPVIIEYKRSLNENAINQGLYYLDWRLDHKAEFKLLVMEQVGQRAADKIEWSNPRLLCIAGDFTKYDEYAVQQINRNIELIRYRRYGNELLLLELVNAVTATPEPEKSPDTGKSKDKTVAEKLEEASPELKDVFESLKAFALALGDDVQMKTLLFYFAFKRLRNFACVEVFPQANKIQVFVKVNPDTVDLTRDFLRDVRNVGHFGTGDLEITLRSLEDLERAKPYIVQSYELS